MEHMRQGVEVPIIEQDIDANSSHADLKVEKLPQNETYTYGPRIVFVRDKQLRHGGKLILCSRETSEVVRSKNDRSNRKQRTGRRLSALALSLHSPYLPIILQFKQPSLPLAFLRK